MVQKRKQHRSFRRTPGKGEYDYLVVVSGIFFLVAFAHAIRIAYELEILIGTFNVPIWASWVALLLAGILAWHGFRYTRR